MYYGIQSLLIFVKQKGIISFEKIKKMEVVTINDLDFQIGCLMNSKVEVMHTHGGITVETPEYITDNSFVIKLNGRFVVVLDNDSATIVQDETFEKRQDAEDKADEVNESVIKENSEIHED